MNCPVIFDTNALIRLFRGTSEEIRRALMGASRVVIPLTVLGEFQAGVESAAGLRRKEGKLLQEFLTLSSVEVHRPTDLTALYYAKIYHLLKRQGHPIPTNDMWIAAETMEIGGRLYSSDHHFAEIPVLNWTLVED